MSKLPISVFIIAQDEADRIPPAIRSVRDWVEEVIVIDSGSTDKTVEIAKEEGATVVFNEWKGYGPQKAYGETLCSQKWLFNVDADEEVSPKLKDEIHALFANNSEPPEAAYEVRTLMCFAHDKRPRPFAPFMRHVRLYDKEKAGFKPELVHDSVFTKDGEKIGKLKYGIYHRCFRSHRHAIEKINRYSSMQVDDMITKGRRPSTLRLLLEPTTTFLKCLLLRRYILFGMSGFVESCIYSFARFIRLAKAREAWAKIDADKANSVVDN